MKTTKLLKKRTMLKIAMLLCLGCFLIPAELKAQLTVSIVSSTNITCNGMCDGSAAAIVSGGIAPYIYQWSTNPVQNDSIATGLCPGTYTITVFDSDTILDTAFAAVTIAEPTALVSSVSSVDASCPGCCDGSTNVIVSGGTAPYVYFWNDSLAQTTATAVNLCSGTYCVSITDANGCTASNCVAVLDSGCTLIISATATDVTTCGGNDGTATPNPTGGVLPYTYLWSNGDTAQNITGLLAGTYTVTVMDSNGCTSTSSAVVNEPGSFFVYLSSIDASCATCADGSATAIPDSGSTPPYTYLWSDSITTTATNAGLLPGTYCVTVTDSAGCTASGCVVILDSTFVPCTLTSTITSTNASCGTCNDGSATVSV
ncbi:MAG: SprB repeat-containing protein, partial [Bacteroidetes bacterium]|nr:SprB repeat-containing protein [Bacteroidota bacterium]